MMTRITLAVAALAALALPAWAQSTCLEDRIGAQCDVFLDDYRSDEVPVGTTMAWPQAEFLVENLDILGWETDSEQPAGDDVLYWDGESAMIVSERSGPQIKIADW